MQCFLPSRQIICLSGTDSRSLLQGLVTIHMESVTPTNARYGFLLSPQGKYLHDFFLIAQGDTILLDIDHAQSEALISRLTRYKLRADVTIAVLEGACVTAHLEGMPTTADAAIIFADPRITAMGIRVINFTNQGLESGESAYHSHRLDHAIPEGAYDMTAEKSLLLEFGWDELGAVDFDKGCYVGQEVTNRTKHRANLRKAIYHVTSKDNTPLPCKDTPVLAGDKEIGVICSSLKNSGLALLRKEEVEKAGSPLTVGEAQIATTVPKWRV